MSTTDIDKRLNALAESHKALSAQHEGLLTVCKLMFAIIETDQFLMHKLKEMAHDALNVQCHYSETLKDGAAIAHATVDELFDVMQASALLPKVQPSHVH